MDGITAWITPALLIALFAWLRFDTGCATNKQFNDRLDAMNQRFDELNKQFNDRFDQVQRGLGDLRERMAKLEGALEGFLAGRRDRDAA